MQTSPTRYHGLAITLHWVMAIAFILMLTSGILMGDIADKAQRFKVFQWHKSLGVILLISFFLRLTIRLMFVHPDLPANIKPLEKKAAKAGHYLLYAAMIAVPFTGWATVSSSVIGLPTIVFGLFEWPHIPGIAGNKDLAEFFEESHGLLAYSFLALIVVHVAAVIKHAAIDHENLLPRMGIGRVKKGNES